MDNTTTDQNDKAGLAREPGRTRNNQINWREVECDYEVGALSLRALATKHGCAHSTIANFASRNGWSRKSESIRRAKDPLPR